MNKEKSAEKLVLLFPEKSQNLVTHYEDYDELLAHVFFSEEINSCLFPLLKSNTKTYIIKKYCDFIEEMWSCGDADTVNVVDVTILERLSDDETVWRNFNMYITNQFRDYINNEVLTHNLMMQHVQKL